MLHLKVTVPASSFAIMFVTALFGLLTLISTVTVGSLVPTDVTTDAL